LKLREIIICATKPNLIGKDFYDEYYQQIIFAISVHEIECWLLPLYYNDNKKAKFKGCLSTLNQALSRTGNRRISTSNKNPDYYETISKQYLKHKVLMSKYEENPSFKVFIEEIEKRGITL